MAKERDRLETLHRSERQRIEDMYGMQVVRNPVGFHRCEDESRFMLFFFFFFLVLANRTWSEKPCGEDGREVGRTGRARRRYRGRDVGGTGRGTGRDLDGTGNVPQAVRDVTKGLWGRDAGDGRLAEAGERAAGVGGEGGGAAAAARDGDVAAAGAAGGREGAVAHS
eukprot:3851578-Rhodomonas_salina.1